MRISRVKSILEVAAKRPKLNKQCNILSYKEQVATNDVDFTTVRIMAVATCSNEEFELISNNLNNSLTFNDLGLYLEEFGGCFSEDERLEPYTMIQISNSEELKKIWFESSRCKVIAILNEETKEYFFIDSQRYSYARYVLFSEDQEFNIEVEEKEVIEELPSFSVELNDRGEYIFKNNYCRVTYRPNAKSLLFSGIDLTDPNNDPSFYSQTKRSKKRAFKELEYLFNAHTTMYDVCQILNENNIRTRTYCAMD